MAVGTEYGVLRGRVDAVKREDDSSSPHLQIKIIDGQGRSWRAPFNVQSGDGSELVFHKADPLVSHPILDGLARIAPGFTLLPSGARTPSNSLDFLRAPLFDWAAGVAVPSFKPGANNDLQDVMMAHLNQLTAQGGDIFVFGAVFPAPGQASNPRPIDIEFGTTQGVHDLHMNQGNPSPGSFAKDNGVHQDGGLLLQFSNRVVGLFGRFQSQLLPTNNTTGHPENGRPVPPGAVPGRPGPDGVPLPPTTFPIVYIERALVNPAGEDTGKEMVVLGNTTTAPVDLSGWSIVDKNNNAEVLPRVVLPGGESRLIPLSGRVAQLSNKGGTIRLKNPAGQQIHAVSFSQADATAEGRFIRFNN